jgi:hypothetical protein
MVIADGFSADRETWLGKFGQGAKWSFCLRSCYGKGQRLSDVHIKSGSPAGLQKRDCYRGEGGTHGGVKPPLIVKTKGCARPATPGEIPR